MENTAVEEKKTIPEKVVAAPEAVHSAVQGGVEPDGHDPTQDAVGAPTPGVEGTKTVAGAIAGSRENLAQNGRPVAIPETEPVPRPVAIPETEPVPRPVVTAAPVA